MRVDILTLFPEMFSDYMDSSILDKAQRRGLLDFEVHNIRDYATGRHRTTDEPPYGGGGGMVLKPEPIFEAVEVLIGKTGRRSQEQHDPGIGDGLSRESAATNSRRPIILLTPQGRLLTQEVVRELSQNEGLILICGRYEGVDERVRRHIATDEISIGDYVLTGGELAAMVIVDAVSRLIPGVLGAKDAAGSDSHATGLLEGPHYTRPEIFREWSVPDVLLSGNTKMIERWRRQQSIRRTWRRRPDLLLKADLGEEDRYFLMVLAEEISAELTEPDRDKS